MTAGVQVGSAEGVVSYDGPVVSVVGGPWYFGLCGSPTAAMSDGSGAAVFNVTSNGGGAAVEVRVSVHVRC